MPTYVYKFTDTGETIEVQQAFSDPTLTEYAHPSDGSVRAVKKVFQPVGITFKGGGFYKTDSRGGGPSTSTGSAGSGGSSESSGSSSTSGDGSSGISTTSGSSSSSGDGGAKTSSTPSTSSTSSSASTS